MSKQGFYIVQQNNIGRYNMTNPRRQTIIPHIVKPAQVVTVVKNKYQQNVQNVQSDFIEIDDPQPKPQRRRERLTHLTQEEKLNRCLFFFGSPGPWLWEKTKGSAKGAKSHSRRGKLPIS